MKIPHHLSLIFVSCLMSTWLQAEPEVDPAELSPQELTVVESVTLGVVEGLTEYLPVSSTGHLILTAHFMDLNQDHPLVNEDGEFIYIKNPSEELPAGEILTYKNAVDAYLIIIQFGAIAAVVILYWKRLLTILAGLMGKDSKGLLLLRNLILAFIPAAIAGLLLEELIDSFLFSIGPVIAALLVGGLAIIWIDRWYKKQPEHPAVDLHELTPMQSLFIGALQTLALWPGTSRSMMTIIGGYLVKLRPTQAAEFSFLLGLVTLTAASIYKGYKVGLPIIEAFGWGTPLLGCFIAAIAAAISVKWMVGFLNKHGLAAFGYYRIAIAILLAIVFYVI